jgi:hypothetical protein
MEMQHARFNQRDSLDQDDLDAHLNRLDARLARVTTITRIVLPLLLLGFAGLMVAVICLASRL